MLRESYIAKLKTLPKDAIKIKVGYPSIFSPSESLLSDFNELRLKLIREGKTEPEARREAWAQTDFEKRYRKKILSNPKLVNKLKEIKELSERKDVYLYCYCGKPLCPRFVLMDIITKLKGKKIERTPCEYIVWRRLPVLRKEIARSMINDFGLNEKETAKKLGITPSAVSQYLSGKRGNIDITNAEVLHEINISAKRIIAQGDEIIVSEICRLCKLFSSKNKSC